MNERIKELLEQAGFDVKRLMSPLPGGFPREDILALESFAELLVQECADYIDTFNKENMVEEGIGGTELKQHFGVE